VILGGLRIGAGALVGAGAVVTKDVEPGAVVAGTPARPLRG
jgi:tetrahydrodipicolinate N-acetyltransferase